MARRKQLPEAFSGRGHALRAELAVLPGFDLAQFDKLRDYALALAHTHAMFRWAAGPVDRLAELGESLAEVRTVLQSEAMALANRGILEAAQVAKLRGGSGYKSLAFEVAGLVGLLRARWSDIQGRSALQRRSWSTSPGRRRSDADSIAPSLYAGRTRAPREEEPAPPAPNAGDAPATPPASAGTNPVPAAGNAVAAGTGLPGSSPFQRS